jgi:hypothetical protein
MFGLVTDLRVGAATSAVGKALSTHPLIGNSGHSCGADRRYDAPSEVLGSEQIWGVTAVAA